MNINDIPFEDEELEKDRVAASKSSGLGGIPVEGVDVADNDLGGIPVEGVDVGAKDYGVMDRQRDTIVAETGDDTTTRGEAFLQNVLPLAGRETKNERDFKISNLERLRDRSALAELQKKRSAGKLGVEEKHRNEGRLRHGIAGAISDIGAGGIAETQEGIDMLRKAGNGSAWEGFKKGISDIFSGKKPEPTDEEREKSYFDQLASVAKNAGINEKRIEELRGSSKTLEDFAEGLRGESVGALTRLTKTKKEAAERLQKNKADWWDTIVNGTISNTGYTGEFILASMAGPLGYAGLIGAGAEQRGRELQQHDYDVAEDGSLIVRKTGVGKGEAAIKGLAGSALEVGIEQGLEKGLGWLFHGAKVPVGKGVTRELLPWLGKGTRAVEKGVGKAVAPIAKNLSKTKTGRTLLKTAEVFGELSERTGIHGIPMEMLEEHADSFKDDVLGLGTKNRDYKGVGRELSDWWSNKFWNKENNKEIFLGLIGTMAAQGVVAGTKAHHDIAKWRQNPAGYLKTMLDDKTVDSLNNDEIRHLYNLVSSPRFTEKNIDRFLTRMTDNAEMANALLQLKEANAPFFGGDQKAVDDAIKEGRLKSQFVPPMRSVIDGANQLDWQPFTMKNGRNAMRLYDPNTGIAIIDHNIIDNADLPRGARGVLVVNRDGMSVPASDLEDALEKADKMSINNQLLDAKRPMKEAYVRKRIEETFPGGDFVIMKNAAELNKFYPDVARSRDYDPTNPAFSKDGKVYLVLDNMRSAYEVNRMILHEAAIHTGLNKKFTTDEKRNFLRNISDADTAKLLNRIGAMRGVDNVDDLSDADVEEAFAHVWDRRRTSPLLTQRMNHALREMGRRVGLPIDYNTDDLEVMVDSLQREGRNGKGSITASDFDTTDHAGSVPYNMGTVDYSGDVADPNVPAEQGANDEAVRQMQRNDRIKANHPAMWQYAMRHFDGDEDKAADFIAKHLEEEARQGVKGEAEHGMRALLAADKLENGEDLTPDDLDILEEHGFTGPILYNDFGYRKQKNGTWKWTGEYGETPAKTTAVKQGKTAPAAQQTAQKPAEATVEAPGAQGTARAGETTPKAEKPVEPAQAASSERTVIERMTDEAPVEELPVSEVTNDDTRIPNFKEGANPETGEVEPLKGEPYDLVSNPIVVMEFNDGKKVVVTGRHRLALYKRSGRDKIPARVIRERDGWTVDDAKAIDAIGNIIDEKGSVKDYVKYFDSAKPSHEQAERGGFLARPKGRRAFGIYEGAGENLRSLIDWEGTGGEGLISVEQAGIIAESAPKDENPRFEGVQRILARKALDGVRGKKLGILARALAEEVKSRKDTPKVEGGQQLDLFTSPEDAALMAAEEKRAGYRAKKANEYNRIAEILRTAIRKGGKLDLNKGYAKELGISDAKNKDQLAAARDKAVERANYWENAVRLDDADKSAMDESLGLAPKKEAKPDLTLESATPEQIKAEEETRKQRAEIKRRQEAPLKGGTGEIGQTQLDLGDTNGDLFNPVVPNKAPTQKPLTGARGAAAKVLPKGINERQLNKFVESGFIPLSEVESARLDEDGRLVIHSKPKGKLRKEQIIYPDGSSKGGNVEVKSESADSDTIQDTQLGEEVIDAARSLEWGIDNGQDQRPRQKMLKDAIAKANAHDLGILIKAAESEMSRRFKWKKNYEGKPIEPTHIYVWRMVKEEAQRRLSATSTTPNTPASFIFGDDKESEKAFTDALDAMWFSRGIEGEGNEAAEKRRVANIEKLRNANDIQFKWENQFALDKDSARTWLLANIRGEYKNADTGETIHIVRNGIRKVTSHGMYNEAHLKSTAAIPDLVRNSIFITEMDPTKDNAPYDKYRYFVAGIEIDGTPYTAKIVVGMKGRESYYDHDLTQISKGDLLEALSRVTNPEEPTNLLDGVYDTKLLEILQPPRTDGNGNVMWFARGVDEHTDEEREAHNLLMGVKAIRAFAKSGGTAFGDFAATVRAYRPEVYERIRQFMPGMWLNARLGGLKDLQERSEAQYQGTIQLVDRGYTYDRATGAMVQTTTAHSPAAPAPSGAEKPASESKQKTRGEAISSAADEIVELIEGGEKFTRQELERIVGKHLGGSVAEGTFEMKDVTDILELAVNRYMRTAKFDDEDELRFAPTGDVGAAKDKIAAIREVLGVIPTQTTRSAEQDKMQQFSTVPHEAFVAAWVANITDKDVMLEPSAGIGGIAVFAKNAGAEVILNELSGRRREILEQLGLAPKVYGFNAEHLWAQFYSPVKKGEVNRPTVVVMNPPFSNSALTSRKDTIGVGGKHIEEALEMLAPGGRLVAIVGHGMAHDTDSPKVKAWWKKIGAKYTVRADVTVNGEEYAKYGTTYDNNMIVIDKVAPNNTKTPVYGIIQSIDELPAMLEGVRNDRPAIQNNNSQSSGKGAEQGVRGRVGESAPGGTERVGSPNDERGKSGVRPQHTERVSDAGNGQGNGRGAGNRVSGRNGDAGRRSVGGGVRENDNRRNPNGHGGRDGSPDVHVPGVEKVSLTSDSGDVSIREVGDGTFSEYRPSKVHIDGAKPHPTPLVESSAMAAVLPPDPTYSPILPQNSVAKGRPSDAQLETVVYAGQAHEQKLADGRRKGYAIGDGTGVGKGTEISAIISDNWNHGRKKAIWITEKAALSNDAKRDLATFGLDGELFDFNPRKKGATGRLQGIGFATYDGLRQDVTYDSNGNVQSTKRGQTNRLQEIIKWLGKDFDGVIVFDEAHNAGNAVSVKKKRGKSKPSAKALAVVALQNALPNARIVYVSATMATEVYNLAFAERLGLWGQGTAFRDREAFISQVSSGGLSVMEIVARDMKSMGVYMARSLSYEGVKNRRLEHKLSPDQTRKYNEFADAWQMVFSRVNDALVATNRVGNGQKTTTVMSALYNAEQRFYNQVLTAMQMPTVIADAKRQLEAGNSVVFQIVNTNEAAQERAAEKQRKENNGDVSAEDLDLSPRDILVDYVERSFPTEQFVEQEDENGNIQYVMLTDAQGNPVENPVAVEAKENLLDKLRMMTMEGNPLDTIIEEFGADNVAEITGRGRRREAVQDENGETVMRFVNRSKQKGLAETDEFNAGKRRVLVFSQAGGTGRSFHADKTFGNQQKRIHYLVQAGWRADTALQGFGRTHRSNEAQPPEYVLCSTDIRGHQRFIATIARRLSQLGSLTAGDRSSAGSGVFSEEDNLENRYALNSVHDLMESIYKSDRERFNDVSRQLGYVKPKMDKRTGDISYVNTLIDPEDNTLDLETLDVTTFLNRILNLRVDNQNRLFDDFMEIMRENIELAKENGTFDPGLEKLQGHKIEELTRTELWNAGQGTGSTDIVEIGVSKKSRKMPFDSARSRMERQAEGRDWTFARNVRSGKVFGVVSLARTKTDASGVVHDQIRCFFPDGTTATLNADDVRFSGERENSERLSVDAAEAEWQKALDEIPELDTTKRYFVTGTLLPVWDRLGVQNPRIYRIAPTGSNSSFLGMEVKADRVNDVLRRFGKTPQSVELTPDMVLNRIVKDGKKIPLLQNGWELKRARVNGDYRIELTGPESRAELEKLARDGLGTFERISYVPRFFIPRTVEGLQNFLAAYPAMPEDGGIGSATGSGEDYSALNYEQRQQKFTDLFNAYQNALSGPGGRSDVRQAHDALDGLIATMPSEELMNIATDYQQYDTGRSHDPVHIMRKMVRVELQKRDAITDEQISDLGMWFSRDIEALADPLSSVAIHEVNEWRKARGLPEMPKYKRTSVESIVGAGKYMASNADEMRRFIEVSARTPQNWTAVEVNAVAQRRLALEQDFDEKTRLINVAEMDGNKEEAQRIREARDLVQDQIDLMDSAINKAKREWGLAGLARRFMLNRDGTFARFTGEMQSIVGRELTEQERQGAWTLWNAYRDAQGKLDEATVLKTAEVLKDIVRKHMAEEEQRHRMGGGKSLSEIENDYQYAIDHIRVHANRAGGVLVGLPNGRKWIDAIRRYHMARAIETGRKLTVDEMLSAIHEDIDGMVQADDHDIMQMITGHGNTYEADNSELEKALREQRRLMNEYQKWEDMMTEGHLPDKTGLIRDEPTAEEREAQRTTREMMREFMQQHPELLQMDASKRLKTIQDSLMKRWRNEIADLQRAIDEGEKIMRRKNTMTYTPEMEQLRRDLEAKRREYREAFPPEPLTHEQQVARVMRLLQARLAKLEEKRTALENATTDAERAAILVKAKADGVKDARIDALRESIEDVKDDIEELKTIHFPEGTPEEFTAMVARRRTALEKNIQRIQTLLANRDFAPQKREPSAIAKRVAADPEIQELVKTRNAATKRLMEERERFRRSVLPYNAGRALDWFNVLTSAPRVLRTMLDLSATMTQGAALFTSHPVMGYRALVESVKAFASEENTDKIMAAMNADPDFAEFQLMGGHVYTVSDISERGVPEEFRGMATKLITINGREYGLDDVPGVKASERSFGTFLNCLNLSVYKAIKASGGWGPTGPTETQKRDIALSLNVASGRGYENKGARGMWERIASAALWAPRFAISGAKMAIGWNIFAPHWTGLTTERSYKDRMISSKVAAQQYVRQIAAMSAWTLLATLLMGRKDPEWLEEVLDPRSSNFLNVRVGNTNVNFFGPIKQWWTFMARLLSGQTRGADGMVRKRDRMQTAGTFVRGKLSPLAGLGMDLLNQKDFLGNKIVWDKEAGNKEVSGWKHVVESLGVPLSMSDLVAAFKENSLANALMLTPFIVAGAGKSTIKADDMYDIEYARVVSPYKAALKEYKAAMKEGRWADVKQIAADNPAVKRSGAIDQLMKNADMTRKYIDNLEQSGKKPGADVLERYERQQQAVMNAITGK